jgi:hypothetical protein
MFSFNDNGSSSSPLTKHDVRRLAPASVHVLQHHGDKPLIAAYAPTLRPLANEVLTAYQVLDMLKADQVALIAESAEQTAVLNGAMLGCSGLLVRDLAGFDPEAYARDADLTFDVVQKAMSLKRFVEQKGVDLPYRDTLIAELTARIDGASAADQAAQVARATLQEKQREVRELTIRFHKELVSFRRTVRAALGSRHVDYRRLRMTSRTAAAEPPVETTPVTESGGAESDASKRSDS